MNVDETGMAMGSDISINLYQTALFTIDIGIVLTEQWKGSSQGPVQANNTLHIGFHWQQNFDRKPYAVLNDLPTLKEMKQLQLPKNLDCSILKGSEAATTGETVPRCTSQNTLQTEGDTTDGKSGSSK